MPYVKHLGTFGQPRESVLAPVRKGVETGIELGLKSQALKAELAKQTYKEGQESRENSYKALEDLSAYMNGLKSDAEREAFKTADTYKQVSTLVKEYLPEYWDASRKELLLLTNKAMFEAKLSGHKARLADKLSRGEALSPEDRRLNDFLDKVDVRLAATAMDIASRDLAWDTYDEPTKAQKVMEALQMLQQTRGSIYTPALGGEGEPGGGDWWMER